VELCDAPPVVFLRGRILYHLVCEMGKLGENATVAERIRFYRMKRDMTGDMLGRLVGLSRHAIMYYENQQRDPLLEDLKKMAVVLEIEVDKLYDDYYRFHDYPYSAKIKEIRAEHNLLQRELGAMLGATRRAVERWESGQNKVTRDVWEKLKDLALIK